MDTERRFSILSHSRHRTTDLLFLERWNVIEFSLRANVTSGGFLIRSIESGKKRGGNFDDRV
jgi:hypothetical protein